MKRAHSMLCSGLGTSLPISLWATIAIFTLAVLRVSFSILYLAGIFLSNVCTNLIWFLNFDRKETITFYTNVAQKSAKLISNRNYCQIRQNIDDG